MSTTVHIPPRLLSRVDARARALAVSRNRFIIATLEHALDARSEWPPELAEMLARPLERASAELLDDSLREVRARRVNRRRPPSFAR